MARTKKYKKKQDSDDEEFELPSPTTSSDDESFVGEEEDPAVYCKRVLILVRALVDCYLTLVHCRSHVKTVI
jgi:hypothetical protein